MPKQYAAPAPYDKPEDYRDIPMTPVQSNQIKAIGHDPATETLAVTFNHGVGAVYHYSGVTKELHAAFISAESIGKFFGMHIQKLPFKKFAPPAAAPAPEAAAAE
ncbi:KTSC domain-containing protein [Xenophilus sp. Marseille-Q4582]|uniref:KTSC domain-containing protein n=1 Tax=Xenophilus sp. Marseille-Q4582 TaxID=2866600 RepID=UPI001CE48424|nr:KTSC domain-containing protein [Xenophilus sp. Marseille-Q4582]